MTSEESDEHRAIDKYQEIINTGRPRTPRIRRALAGAILRLSSEGDVVTVRPHGTYTTPSVTNMRPGEFQRAVSLGSSELFRSYSTGGWTSPDLFELMQALAAVEHRIAPLRLARFGRNRVDLRAYTEIAYHYDLPRAIFAAMSPDLNYSCIPSRYHPFEANEALQTHLSRILSNLSETRCKTVLDLGCGWGSLARHVSSHTDLLYTGISVSRSQIDYCTDSLSDPRIQFFLGDFQHQDNWPRETAIITMIESIEHVKNRDREPLFRALIKKYPTSPLVLQFTSRSGLMSRASDRNAVAANQVVFTGPSHLPNPKDLLAETHNAGYRLKEAKDITSEYAHTAQGWHYRVTRMGADPHVPSELRRLFEIYTAATSAAFAQRTFNSHLFILIPAASQ